jgi:hypothetical protein
MELLGDAPIGVGYFKEALRVYPSELRFYRRKDWAIADTMTREDIQLLYEYDRWANNRVLQASSALCVEAFTRDLGGSFRSVRDTLIHIIGGEWIWLAYWEDAAPQPRRIDKLENDKGRPFQSARIPQCR